MSRSCACRHLIDALRTDPRLLLAPLGAQALWLRLVDYLGNLPEPGVFLLGSRPGSLADISRLVCASESEIGPYLEYLLETGLLVRCEVDQAIAVPDPVPLQRASQSRKNGSLGGRPRKGDTPEAYRLRRSQGSLMLPIAGTPETQKNPDETENPLAGARGLASAASTKEAASSREVSPEEAHALAGELAETGRFNPATPWHSGPVANWLRMGATPELLRGIFAEVADRAKYKPPGAGFGYFERIVGDALAAARAAAPPPPSPHAADHARYHAAAAAWASDPRGPMPLLADFVQAAA